MNNAERTYIMVKPDGVQRGVVGKIIDRFEQKGFQLKGLKLIQPPKTLLEEHYKDLAAKPGTTGGGIRNSVPTVRKVCWVGGEVNSCEAHVVCCSFYCCAEVSVCSFLLFRCTHYSG